MEKGEKFDIYLVNEEENKAPYLFHSLENVVDYRYDTTNRPIILAKIVSNRYDGVYWLAFQVAAMTRKFPNKVYEPRPFSPFLTVSKCRWDSEAKFLKGFEYLENCTRTNYEWNIKFEKPLKEVKFIRRDFERTDSETKYAATDVWKLEYADGSRAIMFNSIGREDYPKYDGYWVYEEKQRDYDPAESKFKCFIISEDYIKEIFNAK